MVIKRIYSSISGKRIIAPNYLNIRKEDVMVEMDNGVQMLLSVLEAYLTP